MSPSSIQAFSLAIYVSGEDSVEQRLCFPPSAQFECGSLYLASERATACLLSVLLGSECTFSSLRRGGSFCTELGHRFKLQWRTNDSQPVTYHHHPSGSINICPVTVGWTVAFSIRWPLKLVTALNLGCIGVFFRGH